MEIALERIQQNKLARAPHLSLMNCGLNNELPVELADCYWLRSIDLSNWTSTRIMGGEPKVDRRHQNFFSGLEDFSVLQRLPSLETLNMSHTGLIDIQFIKTFHHLTEINLSFNQFEDLEPLVSLKDLRTLYLLRIMAVNFDPIKALQHLQKLHLRSNGLRDIGFLKDSTSLVEIDLSRNRIRDIRVLSKLTNLEKLDCSDNFISEIKSLQYLSKLRNISLSYNEVQDIQPLYGLSSLRCLYMNSNRIASLDSRLLQYFPELDILYLNNNPGIQIPASLVVELTKKRFTHLQWDKPVSVAPTAQAPVQPPPTPVDRPLNLMPYLRILLWTVGVGFLVGITNNFKLDFTIIGALIGIVLGCGFETRQRP